MPSTGKEAVDALLAANRERDFAALKMHLHNGFQEAKRQEREEAASVGASAGGEKKEALAERRETFSERWAKAVAEAHPSAAVHPRPTLTLTQP